MIISGSIVLLNRNGLITDTVRDVLTNLGAAIFLGGILVYVCVKNRQWITRAIKQAILHIKNITGISFEKRPDEIPASSTGYSPGAYAAISFILAIIPFVSTLLLLYFIITLDAPSDAAAGFTLFFSSPFLILMNILSIKLGKKAVKMKRQILANISLIIAWTHSLIFLGVVGFVMISISIANIANSP